MDKQTAKIAEQFAKKIRSRYNPKLLLLFGSRARNDNFITSDFDFLIVSEAFRNVPFTERMAEIYKYWNAKQDVEPLCYTPEEFERKKKEKGIVYKAFKEGKKL